MPERDGYIPGVPCWIDTSQPDPEAAVDFYGGLFGWEFEDVMPRGSPRQVLHRPDPRRRRRRGRLASPRARRRWRCGTPTSGSRAPTRPRPRSATPAARVLMEPFDVMDAGPDGGVRRSRGRRVLRLAGEGAQGRAGRQRARLAELQRPRHPRPRRARRRSTARCSAGRRSTLGGGFEMWTLPGYGDHLEAAHPGHAREMAEMGAPEGFEDVVASLSPIADDQPDAPAHWDVTFAVDDADAIAAQAARARRQGARPAVRRPVGADDRHHRPAGRDVHRQQVRPREQGPRGEQRRRRAMSSGRSAGLNAHHPYFTKRENGCTRTDDRPCWPKDSSSTSRAGRATSRPCAASTSTVDDRRGLRLPRAERRRQVDDRPDAHDAADDHRRARAAVAGVDVAARPRRGAPPDRRRAAGGRARPAPDRARAARAAGRGCSALAAPRAAERAEELLELVELERRRRPRDQGLLRRHEAPARPRVGARPRAGGAVPRRADHRASTRRAG